MSAAAETRFPQASLAARAVGEWLAQDGEISRVAISSLSLRDCCLDDTDHRVRPGIRGELWIGALGPFAAVVKSTTEDGCRIEFEEQLPHPIVDHFVSTGG